MFEGVEIIDVVRTNRLDSHQPPIYRPLTGVGNPSGGGDIHVRLGKSTVGEPMAFRQKAAPSRNFLESTQTSATQFTIVQ